MRSKFQRFHPMVLCLRDFKPEAKATMVMQACGTRNCEAKAVTGRDQDQCRPTKAHLASYFLPVINATALWVYPGCDLLSMGRAIIVYLT